MKIKTGLGPEQNKETMRRIRQAVGWDIHLMADANSAYCAADAVLARRAFDELPRIKNGSITIPQGGGAGHGGGQQVPHLGVILSALYRLQKGKAPLF